MRLIFLSAIVAFTMQTTTLAPTGTLRAAYLATNPAHAVKDPKTGEARGAVIDLVRELGRRQKAEVRFIPSANPQAVMDAVRTGQADIGFVAYNPERAVPVQFSQPYMLVHQTFIVAAGSSIRSVRDIDRPNQRIGGGKGDSIALYLGRNLKQAQLVEIVEATPGEALQMVAAGKLDAFGANRQRLTDVLKTVPGLRLLPDDLYGVEQTIVVPNDKPEALKAVNAFIDDVRKSGFLRTAIERSGVIGIGPAPGK